jgi:hypothetical protein
MLGSGLSTRNSCALQRPPATGQQLFQNVSSCSVATGHRGRRRAQGPGRAWSLTVSCSSERPVRKLETCSCWRGRRQNHLVDGDGPGSHGLGAHEIRLRLMPPHQALVIRLQFPAQSCRKQRQAVGQVEALRVERLNLDGNGGGPGFAVALRNRSWTGAWIQRGAKWPKVAG